MRVACVRRVVEYENDLVLNIEPGIIVIFQLARRDAETGKDDR
jgi:hypothetical protein